MDIEITQLDLSTWERYFIEKGVLIDIVSLRRDLKNLNREIRRLKRSGDYEGTIKNQLSYKFNAMSNLVVFSEDYLKGDNLSAISFLNNYEGDFIRIYPHYELSSNKRLSSKNPSIGNLSKDIRKYIVPEKGFKFLSIDFKHQEPWIVINLIEDSELLDLLENNSDFYYSILKKFNVDETKENRDIMKKLWNSIVYGATRRSIEEKDSWIDDVYNWINSNERVKSLRSKVENNIKKDKAIYSIFNLNRSISYEGPHSVREGFNSIFQMTGAGVLYAGLKSIQNTVNNRSLNNKIRISHTLHDEYILEISEDMNDDDIKTFIESLDFKIANWTLPRVEYSVGDSWGECK